MPNLADIPPQFLFPNKELPFLIWIKNLPLMRRTKKELMQIWSQEFNHTFSKIQWDKALSETADANGN